MQDLQRALLVADGRELVGSFERILGFLCEERVSGVFVCVLLRYVGSMAWRCGSLTAHASSPRGLSRGRASRALRRYRRADASTYYLSDSAPARVLGPDAAAHVKVLVSHDASELVAVRVAARRRCFAVRNSKFMAARVGWRPLVGPQRAL